ncbi:MAG: TolC family protein [Burkholderiaceae bacterium]
MTVSLSRSAAKAATAPPARLRTRVHSALAVAVGLLLLGVAPSVIAVCDEDQTRLTSVIVRDTPATTGRARQVLRELVKKAIDTSEKIRQRATLALAEAARDRHRRGRAGALPRIDLTGGVGHASSHVEGIRQYQGGIGRIGLQMGGPLCDGGRVSELTRWRTELARAAMDSRTGLQEQVALQTLSLALERSRYYKHGQVYRQHMRRLGCLVDALERIVKLDGRRRSELVQARKTYQESQSLDMAMNAKRQVELRLQRFVGEPLPRLEGLTTVLRHPGAGHRDERGLAVQRRAGDRGPGARRQRLPARWPPTENLGCSGTPSTATPAERPMPPTGRSASGWRSRCTTRCPPCRAGGAQTRRGHEDAARRRGARERTARIGDDTTNRSRWPARPTTSATSSPIRTRCGCSRSSSGRAWAGDRCSM